MKEVFSERRADKCFTIAKEFARHTILTRDPRLYVRMLEELPDDAKPADLQPQYLEIRFGEIRHEMPFLDVVVTMQMIDQMNQEALRCNAEGKPLPDEYHFHLQGEYTDEDLAAFLTRVYVAHPTDHKRRVQINWHPRHDSGDS